MKVRIQFLNKRDEIMMMKTFFPSLSIVLGLAGFSGSAEATLIRHTFSGTIFEVTGVAPAPWEGVQVGSVWELSYVFDTGTPDIAPSPGEGFYVIDNGSIAIDGVSQEAAFGEIEVLNEHVDSYTVTLFNLPLGGGVLFLGGANPIQNDDIPIDIDLPAWNQIQQFGFGGGPAGFQFSFLGQTLGFTSEVVPGPSTMVFSLVSLVLFRKRSRQVRSC